MNRGEIEAQSKVPYCTRESVFDIGLQTDEVFHLRYKQSLPFAEIRSEGKSEAKRTYHHRCGLDTVVWYNKAVATKKE